MHSLALSSSLSMVLLRLVLVLAAAVAVLLAKLILRCLLLLEAPPIMPMVSEIRNFVLIFNCFFWLFCLFFNCPIAVLPREMLVIDIDKKKKSKQKAKGKA